MKINTKLKFIFLLISLVPLAVISILSYLIAKKSLAQQVHNQLESVAAIQKNRLESIVDQNLERLVLVSSRTQLRLSLENFIRYPKSEYQDKINRILLDARSSISSFRDISVLTIDGKIVASTDKEIIGTKHSDKDSFIRGQKENSADILFLDEDQNLRVYLSGPLLLKNKLLGVIVIESDVENIVSLVKDYSGLAETGETLLAKRDAKGDALFLTPLRFDQHAALSRTVPKNDLNDPMTQALIKNVRFFIDAVDYRKEPVLAATQYIRKTDWGLVVKIDKDEAFAPIIQLRNLLVLIIFVTSIIVILTSLYIARSITRPITNLTRVASRISEGDLSRRVEVTSTDEIGILAKAFNQMAENLIEAKIGLEHKVEKRTVELARSNAELESLNSDLQRSIDELKRLQNKLIQAERLSAVGRLTADVAHEIRNPLTVIGGFANRLEKHIQENTREKDYSRLIVSEVARLERILRDVLIFSREARYHFYHFNINDILSEPLQAFYDLYAEQSIQIETEFTPDLPEILIDKDQVKQAINNLVTNAIDAMPEGGTLTIKTRMEQNYNVNYVTIDIIDTGGGIPEERLDRLFEPFYSTRKIGHGTGLGLSICKNIMEEHKGMIKVSNNIGKGTTFSPCFPYVPPEEAYKTQCWEHTKCGIEKAEGAVERRCIAYPIYGRICWAVAGTFYEGKIQCVVAQQIGDCKKCKFYYSNIGVSP